MCTAAYTRRLIEHRYGRTLKDLQREAAQGGSGDPVLPIVLRRLTALDQTRAQARAARRNVDDAWQRCCCGDRGPNYLSLMHGTEVLVLERQEQAEAEVVWDLLDIRLLLDQFTARPPTSRTPSRADNEELLATARSVAAGVSRLNRETLRRGLHTRGIHISNRRLGHVLQRLRAERTSR